MVTTDQLKAYGADVNEGMARCVGNEALYLRLVASVPKEKSFDRLKESIASGNLDTAFESAHALKGVTGNLSLTPLYNPLVRITELLRAKTAMDYTEILDEILSQRDILAGMCE